MKRFMNRSTYLASALTALACFPAVAFAQDEEDQFYEADATSFTFGDNCEKLEDLTYEDLQILVMAAAEVDQESFCAATLPTSCEDYNWILETFGSLTPARSNGYCHFVPERQPFQDDVRQRQDLGQVMRSNGQQFN